MGKKITAIRVLENGVGHGDISIAGLLTIRFQFGEHSWQYVDISFDSRETEGILVTAGAGMLVYPHAANSISVVSVWSRSNLKEEQNG